MKMTLVKTTTTKVLENIELENSEVKELLSELYKEIWLQACYDADNEEVRAFCGKMWPKVRRLNELLKFRT